MAKTPERERRKRNVVINSVVTTSQSQQDLIDLTGDGSERETFMGIKGNIEIAKVTNEVCDYGLAIVRIPKGVTVGNVSLVADSEFYSQLENLLWSYVGHFPATADASFPHSMNRITLDIKTKRKLRPGDKVAFLADASAASFITMIGVANIFSLE